MKWIKHMSDADNDEFLIDMMEEYGYAGKGRWWSIVGLIGGQMKQGSNRCNIEMSIREWSHFLRFQPKKLLEFFLFIATNKHSNVTIECQIGDATFSFQNDFKMISKSIQSKLKLNFIAPKMLELRDSKNAMRTQRGSIEVEVEVDKENKKEKQASPKKTKGKKTAIKDNEELMHLYHETEAYPPEFGEWAVKKGVKVPIRPIFESFCQNHLKRESRWVNWYSVWQKWISNAKEYNPEYFLESQASAKAEQLYIQFVKEYIEGDYGDRRDQVLNHGYDILCAQIKLLGEKPLTPKELQGKYVKRK